MTPADLKSFAVDLALQTKAAIAASVAPYETRVKQLEAEVAHLRALAPLPGPPGPAGPAGTDGKAGTDGRDGTDADAARIRADVVADLQAGLREMVREEAARTVAAMPAPRDGRDGKDADLQGVKMLVDAVVGASRPEPVDVPALVAREVTKAIAAIPVPKDGAPGARGEKGDPGEAGAPGARGERGDRGDTGAVGSAGAPGERGPVGEKGDPGVSGKDGAALVSALIDRDEHLLLTLSDGQVKDVGVVVGKSLDRADAMRELETTLLDMLEAKVATWERPKDGAAGKDGLGFDDLSVGFDDERGYLLRFTRGTETKDFPIAIPWDAGAWQAGRRYPKGSAVTLKGALHVAQKDTYAKPFESKDWRLAVKAGRDGKDLREPGDGE